MADVHNSSHDHKSGIKLFGTVIAVQAVIQVKEEIKQDSDQKTTDKRPDKVIPCPRCKSMETKFCYFNNYNVNQPRHFCKGCQRYWTAGGALRNVPIGAGRRKNKLPYQGFQENCFFDGSGIHQIELDRHPHHHHHVIDNWRMEEYGVLEDRLPAKRRRNNSGGQLC